MCLLRTVLLVWAGIALAVDGTVAVRFNKTANALRSTKSSLCWAQCISKCEDHKTTVTLRNSTNHTLPNSTAVYYEEDGDSGQSKEDVETHIVCDVLCIDYITDSWMIQCKGNRHCIESCNYLNRDNGEKPDIPTVEMSEEGPYTAVLSWAKDKDEVEEGGPKNDSLTVNNRSDSGDDGAIFENTITYLVEYRISGVLLWLYEDSTWDTSHFVGNLDHCSSYTFRVAAVNQYGTKGFAETSIRDVPVPGEPEYADFVHGPYWDHRDSFFKGSMSWHEPAGWHGSDIKEFRIPSRTKKCTGTLLPPVPIENITNYQAHIKVFEPGFGCIYFFQVEAISQCSQPVKGVSTTVAMDLTDCRKLGYPCPTRPPFVPPGPVRRISATPITNTYLVSVKWSPPRNLGSSGQLDHYAIRWGLVDGFPIEYIPIAENMTKVSHEQHSLVIKVKQCAVRYGVKVAAVAPPEKNLPVQWGLIGMTSFIVPEKSNMGGVSPTMNVSTTTPLDSPNRNSTKSDSKVTPTIRTTQKSEEDARDKNNSLAGPGHPSMIAVYSILPVVSILIIVSFVGVRAHRRNKLRSIDRKRGTGMPQTQLNTLYGKVYYTSNSSLTHKPLLLGDKWEVQHNRLIFGEVLGRGAFGQVMKGCLKGSILTHKDSLSPVISLKEKTCNIDVAIKMLHEFAEEGQKQDFLREIDLMKSIGSHANVVGIIASVTQEEPLCLVVEHLPHGDLLHHLRRHRQLMQETEDSCNLDLRLTLVDLLSMARQISVGMEFLAQKGFVHRDLACRNILVGFNNTVKIGDFGLTRYIYDDKVYVTRKGGKLPLKWMSVEAIFDLTFTTSSDVWSYGVVLFEIITLGGTPYPTISNRDLLRELRAGYRMEQPDNCSNQLYGVMLQCWQEKPSSRPSFTTLRNMMEKMIEDISDSEYLSFDLDENKDYYIVSSHDSSTGGSIFPKSSSDSDSSSMERRKLSPTCTDGPPPDCSVVLCDESKGSKFVRSMMPGKRLDSQTEPLVPELSPTESSTSG